MYTGNGAIKLEVWVAWRMCACYTKNEDVLLIEREQSCLRKSKHPSLRERHPADMRRQEDGATLPLAKEKAHEREREQVAGAGKKVEEGKTEFTCHTTSLWFFGEPIERERKSALNNSANDPYLQTYRPQTDRPKAMAHEPCHKGR